MRKQLLSGWYAVSTGLSTGAAIGSAIFSQTTLAIPALFLGLCGSFIDTISTYCFQGKAIRHEDHDEDEQIALPGGETEHKTSRCFIIPQIAYLSADIIIKNFSNRYFLLDTTFKLLPTYPSNAVFWSALALDLAIKQTFSMTNETYETLETMIPKNKKPFYLQAFKPVSGKISNYLFRIIGALEHTIGDDLLPLLAILPEEALDYLIKNSGAFYGGLLLLALIGVIVFSQTYLFEGAHTEKNLQGLAERQEDNDLQTISKKNIIPLKILRACLVIMGPLHGIGTAFSVHVTCRDLINNAYKWPVSLLAGGFTFFGTALGTRASEQKEAEIKIDEMLARTSATIPLLINS